MSASREIELSKHYEEILERRAALLSDLRSRDEQQRRARKQQAAALQTAEERNRRLLEDVKKTEERLRRSQMTDPDILSLETQYWGSVEDQIPTWKRFLLGKGPDPTDPGLGRPPRKAQQRSVAAGDSSRPPLPRPQTHSAAHSARDLSRRNNT